MTRRLRLQSVIFSLFSVVVQPLGPYLSGESAADEVACCKQGPVELAALLSTADRLYAEFKPRQAAAELRKILDSDPQHFEALIRLARVHIDIGDGVPEAGRGWREQRIAEYRTAERLARRAVEINSNSTWGHFYVAASLGHIAVLSAPAEQVDLAGEVRTAIEKAIALDPRNGFAYHVYGVWHRKMAEIGNASRVFASVLYGRTVPSGSFDKSIEYLAKAVALNPRVIVSRLELARSYMAVEDWPMARAMLASVRDLPVQFSDDPRHKRAAETLLKEINGR